jgi:hypothetical protein
MLHTADVPKKLDIDDLPFYRAVHLFNEAICG